MYQLFWFILLLPTISYGLGWGTSRETRKNIKPRSTSGPFRGSYLMTNADDPRIQQHLPNIYSVAIQQLEELKSGPLCHQIAAVMLHDDCKVLESKPDPIGRRTNDFIDAYAASLSICDLERGSFKIPASCSKFRENVLTELSQATKTEHPQLHVTTEEIEACLTGLGEDTAAWNTWVHYKHKSLMVCEAGKSDRAKAQDITLYQRLTKVVEQLAMSVEYVLQERMELLNSKFQQASAKVEELEPEIEKLKHGMQDLANRLLTEMQQTVQHSSEVIQLNTNNAAKLHEALNAMLIKILENTASVDKAHEKSIVALKERLGNELDFFAGGISVALSTALDSSASLQNRILQSETKLEQLVVSQEVLAKGIVSLATAAQVLSTEQAKQAYSLHAANNKTLELLYDLESASALVSNVKSNLDNMKPTDEFWPLYVCPIATLLIGSYGVTPSPIYSLGLVILGELIGILITIVPRLFGFLWYLLTSAVAIAASNSVTYGRSPALNETNLGLV